MEKYGKLTLLEKFKNGRRYFGKFLCDCGKEKIIRIDGVISGKVNSCGCLKKEIWMKNKFKKETLITAFGETKTIIDWSKDSRCKINYDALKIRLRNKNINVESAIIDDYKKVDFSKDKEINPKIGDKFNRLTLISIQSQIVGKQNKSFGNFICECGKECTILLTSVLQGCSQSCGCYKSDVQRKNTIKRNTKNGFSIDKNKRIFAIWLGIKYRCQDHISKDYIKYGGRGIKICEEWLIYENFRDWSLKNNYKKDLSVDRIDSNYHYCPENCRWATFEQQLESKYNNRQILAFNEVKSLLHWTRDERCKVDINIIKERLIAGWSTEDAIGKELEECII